MAYVVILASLPLLGWLAVVIMCLITLRKGAWEGFGLLLMTMIPAIVLYFYSHADIIIIANLLYGSLSAWILAIVLRESQSWSLTLEFAALLGIVGVIAAHMINPDLVQYWYMLLKKYYTNAENMTGIALTADELQVMLQYVSRIATGVVVMVLLFFSVMNLLIARWIQAISYNPGGLMQELLNIKLDILASMMLAGIVILLLLGMNLGYDLAPVVLGLYFVAGFSLIHALVLMKPSWWWLLIIIYITFIFQAILVFSIVVIIGFLDSWINLRQRFESLMMR